MPLVSPLCVYQVRCARPVLGKCGAQGGGNAKWGCWCWDHSALHQMRVRLHGRSISIFIPDDAKSHLGLGRAPYGLYGVKYIELVSLRHHGRSNSNLHGLPFFQTGLQAKSGFESVLISVPGTLGTWAETRLNPPKAVTYPA